MADNVLQVNLNEQQANDVQLALTAFVMIARFRPEVLSILINELPPLQQRMLVSAFKVALTDDEVFKVEGLPAKAFMLNLTEICKRLSDLGITIAAWNLECHPEEKP